MKRLSPLWAVSFPHQVLHSINGERVLRTGMHSSPALCCFPVAAMWPVSSSSRLCDSFTEMNCCYLELWTEINPFPLKLLLSEDFITATGNEARAGEGGLPSIIWVSGKQRLSKLPKLSKKVEYKGPDSFYILWELEFLRFDLFLPIWITYKETWVEKLTTCSISVWRHTKKHQVGTEALSRSRIAPDRKINP